MLGTPFDITAAPHQSRAAVRNEMVALLTRLHGFYGIIHGDVKPLKMVRCRYGSLRFCDFEPARCAPRVSNDGSDDLTST